MSLKTRISEDIKNAMKARDAAKTETLRFLNAAIKNREIELRPAEIKDDEVMSVLKKLVKQRKESIEEFKKAGRDDLTQKEMAELALLETYLPQQMGRDQVEKLVTQVINDLKATSVKDMGPVMKEVVARSAGAADNKMVSEVVRGRLQPA